MREILSKYSEFKQQDYKHLRLMQGHKKPQQKFKKNLETPSVHQIVPISCILPLKNNSWSVWLLSEHHTRDIWWYRTVCVCWNLNMRWQEFYQKSLFCGGSDSWDRVSEAFLINLPFSLQALPTRLCSFTLLLSLMCTFRFYLFLWNTSLGCSFMQPVSYRLIVCTYIHCLN